MSRKTETCVRASASTSVSFYIVKCMPAHATFIESVMSKYGTIAAGQVQKISKKDDAGREYYGVVVPMVANARGLELIEMIAKDAKNQTKVVHSPKTGNYWFVKLGHLRRNAVDENLSLEMPVTNDRSAFDFVYEPKVTITDTEVVRPVVVSEFCAEIRVLAAKIASTSDEFRRELLRDDLDAMLRFALEMLAAVPSGDARACALASELEGLVNQYWREPEEIDWIGKYIGYDHYECGDVEIICGKHVE